MRVYPDTSVLCWPFDDQSQPRIALETQAVVAILSMAQVGAITLIHSSVLRYEIDQNPDREESRWVNSVVRLSQFIQPLTQAIVQRASELERQGIKAIDALHVACAEAAQADVFLTCDDRLSRHYTGPLTILNPVDSILKLSEQ